MIQTKLGKITKVVMGAGGYDEAMFGLSLTLDMEGSCVDDFIVASWMTPNSDKVSRAKAQADFVERMIKIMSDAKITNILQLNGIPVEVTLDGNTLRNWRVLTEVL